MRKLAILTFQTLDGVMQSPTSPEEDSSGGFSAGGWATPYWAEVMEQVQNEAMAVPYDMLFGRITFESFAAHNKDSGGFNPRAAMMNNANKYVVSNTLTEATWQNSKILTGDIPQQIAALKEEKGPLIQVHGSHGLIQTLLEHDLIDEFRLWTFPIVIGGKAKRLFAHGKNPANLNLIKSDTTKNGVVMGIYRT